MNRGQLSDGVAQSAICFSLKKKKSLNLPRIHGTLVLLKIKNKAASCMNLDIHLKADPSHSQNLCVFIFVKPALNTHHQCSTSLMLLWLNGSEAFDYFNAARFELQRQTFWFLDTSPSTNFTSRKDKNKIKWRSDLIIISLCPLLSGNIHQHPLKKTSVRYRLSHKGYIHLH